MKKLLCLLLALMLSVSLFVSCGSGTSIAIGALRLDNQVENLFKFTDAVSYRETLTYTDKDGNPTFTAEYYYEVAEDIYSAYNLMETIDDYTLYAYEGSVYTETKDGMTAVLLLSGSYLDFVNTYFAADFLLDGETHIQRSSETKDDLILAQYATVLTPQQQARVSEFGVKENMLFNKIKYMSEQPIAIKQIKIGEDSHEINSKYWDGRDSSAFDSLVSEVGEKLDKQIFEDNINIDETGEFIIKDNKDNIGLKLDAAGLQVKDVTSVKDGVDHVLTKKADIEYVNNYINEKIFVGTLEQWEAVKDNLSDGALVVITEINVTAGAGATAKLGTAVLGKMKLGQN